MPDIIHEFSKFIDRWRYTALGILLAAGLVCIAACEVTATNPVTGEQAPAAVIDRDVDLEAERLLAEAKAADRIYAASLESERRRHEETLAGLALVHTEKAAEITGDLSALATKYEAAVAEIEAKAAQRAQIVAVGQEVLMGINPALAAAVGIGMTLVGAGAVGDKKRTNAVLAKVKAGSNQEAN